MLNFFALAKPRHAQVIDKIGTALRANVWFSKSCLECTCSCDKTLLSCCMYIVPPIERNVLTYASSAYVVPSN